MLLIPGNNESKSKTCVEKILFCGSFVLAVLASSILSAVSSILTVDEVRVLLDLSGFEIIDEEIRGV